MGSLSRELVKGAVVEGGRNFCKVFFVQVNWKQALEEERLISRAVGGGWSGTEGGSPGGSNQFGGEDVSLASEGDEGTQEVQKGRRKLWNPGEPKSEIQSKSG